MKCITAVNIKLWVWLKEQAYSNLWFRGEDSICIPFSVLIAFLIENVLQGGSAVANIDHRLLKIAGHRSYLISVAHFDESSFGNEPCIKASAIDYFAELTCEPFG